MREPTDEQLALLGHDVIVCNPSGLAQWHGRAIAIAMDPSIVIEYSDGFRVTLPLAWAQLAAPPADDFDAQLDAACARSVAWVNKEFDHLLDCLASHRPYMTPRSRRHLLEMMMEDLDALD